MYPAALLRSPVLYSVRTISAVSHGQNALAAGSGDREGGSGNGQDTNVVSSARIIIGTSSTAIFHI